LRKEDTRCIVVFLLVALSFGPPARAQAKQKPKSAPLAPASPTASPKAPPPALSGNPSLPASQTPPSSTEYPADYIPCVFTLQELLGLRLKPMSVTLTANDEEHLKERLISEATAQADSNTLSPTMKLQFLNLVGQASFEGLTPSQALAAVIGLLRDADTERTVEQLEVAAESPSIDPLVNLAKQQLPMDTLDAEDGPIVESRFATGLTNAMEGVDRLTQLATNVSGLMSGLKYSHPQFDDPVKRLTQNLQDAAVALQSTASDLSARQTAAEEEAIAKQVIVDTARSTVQAFQRPPDVGCAMSILSWNEVRFAFGRIIANEYIGVQIVVRNLNDKQEFSLHDAELSVDSDINGRFGRFYSSRDKLIVRGVSLAQADYTPRNLTVHIAEAAGTVMSAALPVAGGVFKDAVGVYNGGFLPGLKTTWTDHSVDQLNLLSDIGFSSSTNYKTVVPKSGSVMFVMFIPSKQFEEGWWTQKCAEHISLLKQSPQFAWVTPSVYLSKRPENVGVDLPAARELCRKYGTPAPNIQKSSAGGQQPDAQLQQSATANADEVTDVLSVTPVHYQNWSPIALDIFQELAWAVVAGAHIQETSNQSAITQLNCPANDMGNILFNKTATVSCDITGEGLDKVATLRLRNAQDATDTDTADGPVTVSGDATKAKVTFQISKLCGLNKPAYKVYTVTSTGVEAFANQTLHFDLNPFVTDLTPNTSIDPNATPTMSFTLKGCHLDKIAKVQLFEGTYKSGDKALLPYDLDAGGTATQAAFAVKAADDDLKTKANTASGEILDVRFQVKNSSIDPVDGGTITLKSAVSLSPDTLAFDAQTVKTTSAAKTVTLANSGATTLGGLLIKITGANVASFGQSNTCDGSVAEKADCVITVKFTPAVKDKNTATLNASYTITGSKQAETATVALTGTGTTSVAATTSILSSKTVIFSAQRLKTTSSAKTVTVTNSGATELTGLGLKLGGANPDSFKETSTCKDSVAIGAKCILTLTFEPSTAVKLAATLNITYTVNGKKQSESITLRGTGTQ
jgi:hypothetical protein